MYFLKRKDAIPTEPGNKTQPKPLFKWVTIYHSPDRWPLELFLSHMDPARYKITESITN